MSANDTLQPQIDYLARDYASLRQLILDHLALQIPDWTERHSADLGITLVELLAYAADYLSYYQDAVAAEAYLATARQRISLRRHARLLDYPVLQGSNARTFVQLQTATDRVIVPMGTPLLTQTATLDTVVPYTLFAKYDGMVFETMHPIELFHAGNRMQIDTGNSPAFTLSASSTEAVLQGHLPHLAAGDVLLFEQSSTLPLPITSTPARPHAVRLSEPPVLTTSSSGQPVTSISWFYEDALPADLLVSARMPDGRYLQNLCTVSGNIVLAAQGRTIHERLKPVSATGRFTPKLAADGITHAAPYSHRDAIVNSAASSLLQDPRRTRAIVTLIEHHVELGTRSTPPQAQERQPSIQAVPNLYPNSDTAGAARSLLQGPGQAYAFAPRIAHLQPAPQTAALQQPIPAGLYPHRTWTSRQDLLASNRFARDFVVEIDNEGVACLRFGDGTNGRQPMPGTVFHATCQVGQGVAGNVGAEAICHIVGRDPRILKVRNPLPAVGGLDPETANRIRTDAPQAFRIQRRCITEDDYVSMACQYPGIGSAVAQRIWRDVGSTLSLHIARTDRRPITPSFADRLRNFLLPFALIGDSLEVSGPQSVPLKLSLRVTVRSGYSQAQVTNQVRAAVKAQVAVTSLDFGETVQSSNWIALASNVPGVADVQITFTPLSAPVLSLSAPSAAPSDVSIDPTAIARIERIEIASAGASS
jgi:Baseplate J-like protein